MKYLLIFLFGLSIVAKPSSCNKKAVPENGDGFYPLNTKMDLDGFSMDCKQFIKGEVRTKWKLHEGGECYFNDQPFWESVLGRQDCFIGKSKTQLESVFGTPSKMYPHKDTAIYGIYYMGDTCATNYPYWYLSFIYDKSEKLIKIGQDRISQN